MDHARSRRHNTNVMMWLNGGNGDSASESEVLAVCGGVSKERSAPSLLLLHREESDVTRWSRMALVAVASMMDWLVTIAALNMVFGHTWRVEMKPIQYLVLMQHTNTPLWVRKWSIKHWVWSSAGRPNDISETKRGRKDARRRKSYALHFEFVCG